MIAEFINSALNERDDLVLQRSEIAQQFGCVPSQINYVISTRFSPEHGFIVESRRGGGGYIRIRRVTSGRRAFLMHTVNSIGSEIDLASITAILTNMISAQALSSREARLIAVAMSEQSLNAVAQEKRPTVRADSLKRMLVFCSNEE
jgi:transcriptional regulator CtsR